MIFLQGLQDPIKVILLMLANLAETFPNAYNKNPKWQSINRIKITPKMEDLNSVYRLLLWIFIISIWTCFCKVGQHQNDHFDVVLQTMQKDQGVWFRNKLPQMLKVGIMITWSKMTISICCHFYFSFYFPFHCFVFLWTWVYCFGFKVISHTSNKHPLINIMHTILKNASFC